VEHTTTVVAGRRGRAVVPVPLLHVAGTVGGTLAPLLEAGREERPR
jgi:hypothetical protein